MKLLKLNVRNRQIDRYHFNRQLFYGYSSGIVLDSCNSFTKETNTKKYRVISTIMAPNINSMCPGVAIKVVCVAAICLLYTERM